MPVCRKCGRMAATAEMRRSTIQGEWLCKDTGPCAQRRAAARAREIQLRKGKKR